MKTSTLDWLSILLIVIGAINWGVIGVTGLMGSELNLVVAALDPVFEPGVQRTLVYLIYVLVGLAGVYFVYPAYKMARDRRKLRNTA